jgi:hypothetical protein
VTKNRFYELLPRHLKTATNRKVSALVEDPLFEPESTEAIIGQLGTSTGLSSTELERNPILPELTPQRQKQQLTIAAAVGEDGSVGAAAYYDDLIGSIEANGGIVSDRNRLFNTLWSSWTPPIAVDRWTNFYRYVWTGEGDARVNGEYITKDPDGSQTVVWVVQTDGTLLRTEVAIYSGSIGSHAAGTIDGQLVQDSSRRIYSWNAADSQWGVVNYVPAADVPEETTLPPGTCIYVARTGHLYQRAMLMVYSEAALRWIPKAAVISPTIPESPVDGMIWESCYSPPDRTFHRYSADTATWTQVSYSSATDWTGLGLGIEGDVVYLAYPVSGVADGWSANNWWVHYDDLSPTDKGYVTRTAIATRPIVQFWGSLEAFPGDARSARHDEPRFSLYAWSDDAGEIVRVDEANFGENSHTDSGGNRILSFRRSAGTVDVVLGFAPTLSNTGEYMFDLDLESVAITSEDPEVKGYRYFKDLATGGLHGIWSRSTDRTQHLPDGDGLYGVPVNLSNNPDHDLLTSFSRSDVLEHFSGILSMASGDPSSNNGYRWSDHTPIGSYGIIDPDEGLLKALLLQADPLFDLPEAIRTMANEDARFHRRFITKMNELWNDEDLVTPENVVIDNVNLFVERVLSQMLANKSEGSVYWQSGMGTYTDYDTNIDRPIAIPPSPARVGAVRAVYPHIFTLQGKKYVVGHDGRVVPSWGDQRDVVWRTYQRRIFDALNEGSRTESPNLSAAYHSPWNILRYVGNSSRPVDIPAVNLVVGSYSTVVSPTEGQRVFSRSHGSVATYRNGEWTLEQVGAGTRFWLNDTTRYVFNGLEVYQIKDYQRPYAFDYSLEDLSEVCAREFQRWCVARSKDHIRNDAYDALDRFTWNYSSAGVEGHWRGIYRRVFGTDRPNSHPWEIVGFSMEPDWWRTVYVPSSTDPDGLPKYNASHSMWTDIRNGCPSSAILLPEWAKAPTNFPTPVDASGNLKDPIDCGIVTLASLAEGSTDDPWKYGDRAPIECEFWESPEGRYALSLAGYLMKPAAFTEALWSETAIQIGGPLEPENMVRGPIVVNDSSLKRLRVADTQDHSATESNTGIVSWISERISLVGGDPKTAFFDQVRTGRPMVSWKAGGFVSSDSISLALGDGTPVPSEDVSIVMHRSPPIDELFHGGIAVIRDGSGYRVHGYDLSRPRFLCELGTSPSVSQSTVLRDESVSTDGQTKILLTAFQVGASDLGRLSVIIDGKKVQSSYYAVVPPSTIDISALGGLSAGKSISVQLSLSLVTDTQRGQNFSAGGKVFRYFPRGSGVMREYSYGHVFTSPQEVVSFIADYGRVLHSDGWRYDDPETGTENGWFEVAKRFAAWATEGRSEGEIFADVAGGMYLRLEVDHGSVMDLSAVAGGSYSIVDMGGLPITGTKVSATRSGNTLELRSTDRDIFGVRARINETEHAVLVSNSTKFNDLVYSPSIGTRHKRLMINAYRTKGWKGRLEAPGFVVLGDRLIPNFDKLARDAGNVYNMREPNASLERRRGSFGLYGWWPRPHIENVSVSAAMSFDFHRGAIRKKGTKEAIDAYLASTVAGKTATTVIENWAWKSATFGNIYDDLACRFVVQGSDIKDRFQVVRFETGDAYVENTDVVVGERNSDGRWLLPPTAANAAFPLLSNGKPNAAKHCYSLLHVGTESEVLDRYFHWDPEADIHEPASLSQIDLKSRFDPARYNKGPAANRAPGQVWGKHQVGKIWWDTTRLSYSSYRTISDLRKRVDRWGQLSGVDVTDQENTEATVILTCASAHGFSVGQKVFLTADDGSQYDAAVLASLSSTRFEAAIRTSKSILPSVLDPGSIPSFRRASDSDVQVYEWVESDVPPIDYPVELGRPKDYYSASYVEDTVDGVAKYYFWARWRTSRAPGKFMSIIQIESVLRDPAAYGRKWFAPISPTAMCFDSSSSGFEDGHSLELRISAAVGREHTEWTLVRENHDTDPVSGEIVTKLLDSILGRDELGNIVPNTLYVGDERYGSGRRQTVFRDRAAARSVLESAINSALQEFAAANEIGFTTAFPTAARGSWWEARNSMDSDFVVEIVTTVRTMGDLAAIKYPLEGDIVRVVQAQVNPIIGSPHYSAGAFRRENGQWVQFGLSYSTAGIVGSYLFELSEAREIVLGILNFLSVERRNRVIFSLLYEMLAQGDCSWFFKTSLIDINHAISLGQPLYNPKDEVPLISSAITELKPFHTKIRTLNVVATHDRDDANVDVGDANEPYVVEHIDRLSSNLLDEFGFGVSQFGIQPFDLQPGFMENLGRDVENVVTRFDTAIGQVEYAIDVAIPLFLSVGLSSDEEIPDHTITRVPNGSLIVRFDEAPASVATVMVLSSYAGVFQVESWSDRFPEEYPSTYDHLAYRAQALGYTLDDESDPDGGSPEERVKIEAPNRSFMRVSTYGTDAYSGFDAMPLDFGPFDSSMEVAPVVFDLSIDGTGASGYGASELVSSVFEFESTAVTASSRRVTYSPYSMVAGVQMDQYGWTDLEEGIDYRLEANGATVYFIERPGTGFTGTELVFELDYAPYQVRKGATVLTLGVDYTKSVDGKTITLATNDGSQPVSFDRYDVSRIGTSVRLIIGRWIPRPGLINCAPQQNELVWSTDPTQAPWTMTTTAEFLDILGIHYGPQMYDARFQGVKLFDSSAVTIGSIEQTVAGSLSPNVRKAASIFVKKGPAQKCCLQLTFTGGAADKVSRVVFLPSDGTYAIVGSGASAEVHDATDYWKLNLYAVNGIDQTDAVYQFYPVWNTGTGTGSNAAATGSQTVWGMQLNDGDASTATVVTDASARSATAMPGLEILQDGSIGISNQGIGKAFGIFYASRTESRVPLVVTIPIQSETSVLEDSAGSRASYYLNGIDQTLQDGVWIVDRSNNKIYERVSNAWVERTNVGPYRNYVSLRENVLLFYQEDILDWSSVPFDPVDGITSPGFVASKMGGFEGIVWTGRTTNALAVSPDAMRASHIHFPQTVDINDSRIWLSAYDQRYEVDGRIYRLANVSSTETFEEATDSHRPVLDLPDGGWRHSGINFNGNHSLSVTDPRLEDFWSGGSYMVMVITIDNDGWDQHIIGTKSATNDGWELVVTAAGKLRLIQNFSTTNGSWTSPSALSLGEMHIIEVNYSSTEEPKAAPQVWIDGSPVSMIQNTAPTGSLLLDTGDAMWVGNSSDLDDGFDGKIHELIGLKVQLTNKERSDVYSTLFDKWKMFPDDPLVPGDVPSIDEFSTYFMTLLSED